MDERDRLAALAPVLRLRCAVNAAIRGFFLERGFVEVETPVRVAVPAMERHIDAEPSGDAWLRTSPELHMKRLLAAGMPRLFQIGPCFRRGERGERHHPEYSMLEWYRAGADYRVMLAEIEALLRHVALAARARGDNARTDTEGVFTRPWIVESVRAVFQREAGWDPVAAYDDERFERDLVNRVEPALPRDRCVALVDYPAAAGALARLKPGDPAVAERWELYAGGLELANAFSELTDASEQRRRFERWGVERCAQGSSVYPLDEPFLTALAAGLPPSGGVALGVDRLVMVLAGLATMDDVLPFREG